MNQEKEMEDMHDKNLQFFSCYNDYDILTMGI